MLTNSLTLNIEPPKRGVVSSKAFAIYHGRVIEMLLAHFDTICSSAQASAMPSAADVKAA